MVNEISAPNELVTTNNGPISGEFATTLVAKQHFADIRALYPNIVNWQNINQTVSLYAAIIAHGLITDESKRTQKKQAKEHLLEIINLEILKADSFFDVPCTELFDEKTCLKTCGCTDPDNDDCCCPEVNFAAEGLRVVWLKSMILNAFDAQGNDLDLVKNVQNRLCWYDIPSTAVKLEIQLSWRDIFNKHEVDLAQIQ